MTAATLRSLADEMAEAFMGELVAVSKSERIVELSGAQWLGVDRNFAPLVMFRDPVTKSTCALPEADLTVTAVLAKLESKRAEFRGMQRGL